MPPIRVLIVDDSVVIRKILTEDLASDPEIEVAGSASSGNLALAKIPQLNPDIITLDIEMPGLNGLQTLAEIRKLYPKLPVIMFSTLTERGASATLDALSLGATDYVTKPSNSETTAGARAKVREELTQKIKSLFVKKSPPGVVQPFKARAPIQSRIAKKIDLVAIGTSTGGPNALAEVIPVLPENFPVPVVVVQHMPPLFTKLLAERLDSRSNLRVREGEVGKVVEAGNVWIAPGNYHMTVHQKELGKLVLGLNQEPPENSCRPAVDVLFRSVAALTGVNVLSVVMTGMGADGTRGAREIREVGGEVFIQDEATSVVWGMPGSVKDANLADRIIPLPELGPEISRRVQVGRRTSPANGGPLRAGTIRPEPRVSQPHPVQAGVEQHPAPNQLHPRATEGKWGH